MISTQGYQLSVMPQAPVVDPGLYAFDPQKITQGFNQATETLSNVDKLKAFREQQKELKATRDARIAHIQAISDLAVLQTQHQHAIDDAQKTAELAGFGLKSAQDTGSLQDLGSVRAVGALQRGYETTKLTDETQNYEKDKALEDRVKAATASNLEAEARWRDAEAARQAALAATTGIPKDEATKKFEEELGRFAVETGIPLEKARAILSSNQLNNPKWGGVPVGTELAAIMKIKPDKYTNVFESVSPELKTALGSAVVTTLADKHGIVAPGNIDLSTRPVIHNKDGTISTLKSISIGTPQGEVLIPTIAPDGRQMDREDSIDLFYKTGQHLGIYDSPESATKAAKEISKAQGDKLNSGPPVIKLDKDFNIINKGNPSTNATPPADAGVSLGGVAEGTGLTALGIASSPKAQAILANIGKAGGRMWEGRSALGQFTGGGIRGILPRAMGQLGGLGVRAASLPAAAAYEGNKLIGGALSDKNTGDLSALEGIALSGSQDSAQRQAQEAHYDELSHRIQMVVRSGGLSDEQKKRELELLLNQREMLWSMMGQPEESSQYTQTRPADYR